MEMAIDIISLITGLCGLIIAGIGTYFAIKNFIEKVKAQTFDENWQLIQNAADAAMIEAEQSINDGETKKQIVIDSVTALFKGAGVDISEFTSLLNTYIDDCITFANKISGKK